MESADNTDGILSACISNDKPLHIKFKNYEDRLKSFHDWPNSGKPDKCVLAKAGPNDRTICFYCDGGVNNWTPKDDPLEEHFVIYPECAFIKKLKKKHKK